MPDAFARVVLHTTFSTKYRVPNITPEVEGAVLRLLNYHLQQLGAKVLEINAVTDHVHIVHTLPRTISISDLLREIKKRSSNRINDHFGHLFRFEWQAGYATFSVDCNNTEPVVQYVRNQKQRHGFTRPGQQQESFVEEYTRLLLANGFEVHPYYTFPVAPKDERA